MSVSVGSVVICVGVIAVIVSFFLFLVSGQLVSWSVGVLVCWCVGVLVCWCVVVDVVVVVVVVVINDDVLVQVAGALAPRDVSAHQRALPAQMGSHTGVNTRAQTTERVRATHAHIAVSAHRLATRRKCVTLFKSTVN